MFVEFRNGRAVSTVVGMVELSQTSRLNTVAMIMKERKLEHVVK